MSDTVTVKQGHPNGLYILFFSEMWERFCYYGMRALLVLYMVNALMKGDSDAFLIYGAYTGLVYAAAVFGGRLADRYLGYRMAIILGAVLMAIGEFMILGGNDNWLLIGMGAIIVGNGYFKANISTIVGKLYEENDPRRDSGFTIFYIGINLGSLLATTIVAYIGEVYDYKWGFGLAGLGMISALFIFWFGRDRYAAADGLDIREEGKQKGLLGLNKVTWVVIGSLATIPACYFLILQNEIIDYLLGGVFLMVSYTLIKKGIDKGPMWRDRMIALVIFIIINIAFWASFEQAGTSLTLFASRNVDRVIFGWEMPATMTQSFNAFFIIVIGTIFSKMWIWLSRIGRNPSIPMKFSYGILQAGLGFLVVLLFSQFAVDYKVPLLTLVFLYLLHTTGELFLSPIGLSMVTKLAPAEISGTAMGGWFLSYAIANFVAGKIATLTGAENAGGAELPPAETFQTYVDVFSNIGFVLIGIAILIALLSKPLNKLMHGVR